MEYTTWFTCKVCNFIWDGKEGDNCKENLTTCWHPAELSRKSNRKELEVVQSSGLNTYGLL